MATIIRSGAVVFSADVARLTRFYEAMTGMTVDSGDGSHTVLVSDTFELVIHALRGEPSPPADVVAREDTYIKLFFPVASLASARDTAARLGGRLYDASQEWESRGFRACDGIDPEGNVVQFREPVR